MEIAKGQRITGDDRVALGKVMRDRYESGASIRELSAETGRSYGFVHRLLIDAGVELRRRGGANAKRS